MRQPDGWRVELCRTAGGLTSSCTQSMLECGKLQGEVRPKKAAATTTPVCCDLSTKKLEFVFMMGHIYRFDKCHPSYLVDAGNLEKGDS